MGRLLKRVPLNFAAPLNVIWPGYLRPHFSRECGQCGGTGYNPETNKLAEDFYDFARTGRRWVDAITQDEIDALVKEDRLAGWVKDGRHPTAAQVNASTSPLKHDAINRDILIRARATRLGVYGVCGHCAGEGETYASPEAEAAAENWQPTEPPAGDGYQLWENTSEGSPTSPVFSTLDELCAWAAENATTFADFHASAADWKRMLSEGTVAHTEQAPDGTELVFL